MWTSKLLLQQPIWVWSEFVLGDYWKFSLLLIRYLKTLRDVKIVLKMVQFLKYWYIDKTSFAASYTMLLIKKIFMLYINIRSYLNLIHFSTIKFWLIDGCHPKTSILILSNPKISMTNLLNNLYYRMSNLSKNLYYWMPKSSNKWPKILND